MKKTTMSRKKTAKELSALIQPLTSVGSVIINGKKALDSVVRSIGIQVAEALFYMERESIAGPDYHPLDSSVQKWSSQRGSVYLGKSKVAVERPRLRGPQGEIHLQTYECLKKPDAFSEELLNQWLAGMSGRQYEQVVESAVGVSGISPSSVSRKLIMASAKRLEEFRDRPLAGLSLFAVYLDSVHRGGNAFIVAVGVTTDGMKHALDFWEGATENSTICEELFKDLERRGLKLHDEIIFITDGGKGVIKALRNRFGNMLIHQRCVVHKLRNIINHLPKHCRQEASRKFNRALDMIELEEAQKELKKMLQWLKSINLSAATSLQEGYDELLTLHTLKIPASLRQSLRSTNAIEGMFSQVRLREKNIRRYRSSAMSQRWLGSVLLHCERGFRKIKGYKSIKRAVDNIDKWNNAVAIYKCAA